MTEPIEITKPGVYPDLSGDDYHAQRDVLSSSGAKALLPPSAPALFRHGVREPKAAWDMGHAAHLRVLGEGPELVEVEADDWRTKAAQQKRDEARTRGAIPLLTKDIRTVDAMADAIRRHPLASVVLAPGTGVAEESLFWEDEQTGVMLRCRPDWRAPRWVADYKSAVNASPVAFAKSIYNYGYYIQAPWYLAGLVALGLADPEMPFLFVAQEKTPPYLVSVHQLDDEAMAAGAAQMRRAIDTFAACLEAERRGDPDAWPGYTAEVVHASLPPWAARDLEAV